MGGGPAEARAGQTFGRYPLGREIVKEDPLRPREGAVAEGGKRHPAFCDLAAHRLSSMCDSSGHV